MNILLLGSNGMVGRNIQEHPEFKEYNFFCPVRKSLDIFNKNHLIKFIKSSNINFIINAAGKVGGIRYNIENPFNFLHENLMIGMNLVTATKECNVAKVLNLGSSCIYPKNISNAIKEADLLSGKLEETNEGYALAKITTLKYFEYLSKETNYNYKTLIPCNLFGRHDYFDINKSHLISAIILKMTSISNTNSIEIWGDGTARREFMDAYDLADAIFFSIKNYEILPNIVNVGTGVDYTIEEYYKKVAEVIGFTGNFVFNKEKPTGMKRKLLNVDIMTKLGWSSKISLKDGIKRAYDYYMELNK